jgi:hypothetical protein
MPNEIHLDSSRLKHVKVHHPEYLLKNLTVRSVPRRVEPAQHRDFNAIEDSVKDLNTSPYLKHLEQIADSESQPPPPQLPRMETYPVAC